MLLHVSAVNEHRFDVIRTTNDSTCSATQLASSFTHIRNTLRRSDWRSLEPNRVQLGGPLYTCDHLIHLLCLKSVGLFHASSMLVQPICR